MKSWLALPLLLLPSAPAQDGSTAAVPAAAPALEDLAWLAGHWVAQEGGVRMEELWTEPGGGMMLGLHRDVELGADQLLGFEYLRIVADGAGIRYLASPDGARPTAFTLRSLEGSQVTFENPSHDFPRRVTYRRDGSTLTAWVEDSSGRRGLQWRWELADQ